MPGTIPTSIGLLTALQTVDVKGCGIFGAIPTEIGLLSATLTRLNFSDGTLRNFPSEIGLLTALTTLDVSGNKCVRGTIPSGSKCGLNNRKIVGLSGIRVRLRIVELCLLHLVTLNPNS